MNTHHTPAQEAIADYVPVVTSLLGTDLYKFTMLQPMLHSMPANQAEYRFVCRNEAAYPRNRQLSQERYGWMTLLPACD